MAWVQSTKWTQAKNLLILSRVFSYRDPNRGLETSNGDSGVQHRMKISVERRRVETDKLRGVRRVEGDRDD